MSVKKKFLLAYLIIVILPMFTIMSIVSAINSPLLNQVEGGFKELDKHIKASSLAPILLELHNDQMQRPEAIYDQAYLNEFLNNHKRLLAMSVKQGGQTIYQSDKYAELDQIARSQSVAEELWFRSGDKLYQVNIELLPLNLTITGNDIRRMVELPIRWGIISYVVFHIVFVGYVLKYFLKPFNKLTEVAGQVSRKDYDFELDTNRCDEIGDTYRAFEGMRQSIQTYELNRKELVANISHDLKTPITAIKGYIAAIQDGVASNPEKLGRYLEIMDKNVAHLDQLVDDLFLHSKLDVDQVDFDLRPMALEKYLDYIVDDIRLELEPQGFNVDWTADVAGEVLCRIDSFKMRRVILNLVDNAVKHANKTEKQIRFKLSVESNQALVTIRDNGKGISESDISQVFERFYRADSSRNTNAGGSGLGLAICKQILDKHGGSIAIASQINLFTEIEIRLPLAAEKDQ